MYLPSGFCASLLLLLTSLSLGCAPRPSDLRSGSPHTTLPVGNAALYGRVVAHNPNPLVPGGVEVEPVPGAQIMLFRPSFPDPIPPGTYRCEFERFLVGDRINPYLLRSGRVELISGHTLYRRHLIAAVPQPPPLTDYTGRFVLTGLASGRYVVEIAAERYQHRFVEFSLPDSSVTRTFVTQETLLDLLPEYELEP